jgi:UDPglucose--hexose-1-phosphate uridylyltransferase
MAELRRDGVTGRWVIVSEERAGRPDEYAVSRARLPASAVDCPFCEGREAETTPERFALRSGTQADGPGWRVRVVGNRYPALKNGPVPRGDGLSGDGEHEVVIDTARHVVSLAEMTVPEVRELLGVWRTRLRTLGLDGRLAYASVFKNVGGEAGASIEHSHSQILAAPIVPPAIEAELDHAAGQGGCPGCAAVPDGLVVASGERFVASVPWAARMPYEVRVIPRRHESRFEAAEDAELDELAALLRSLVARVEAAAGKPAYHVVLHTAPLRTGPLARFHWRVEILPRTTGVGGFEWTTGMHINPMRPEESARRLREAAA